MTGKRWTSMAAATVLGLAVALATWLVSFERSSPSESVHDVVVISASTPVAAQDDKGRIVIIGFDGMDPDHLQRWIDKGELPTFAKLAKQGTLSPLGSTIPPQSPVAWSSFITGTGPGEHGVFDFVTRDPKTYFPQIGAQHTDKPLVREGKLVRGPRSYTRRVGRSFWDIAVQQGHKVTVLTVPFSFPPEEHHDGELRILAGLGVPDLRGTNSTFTFVTSDPEVVDAKTRYSGGALAPLSWDGEAAEATRGTATLEGPRDPYEKKYKRLGVPMTVERKGDKLAIAVGDSKTELSRGQWSDWLDVTFARDDFRARGFVRVLAMDVGEHPRLYISPVSPHLEDHGHTPKFFAPDSLGKHLLEQHGRFKTVGWFHDTSALNEGVLSDEEWLTAVHRNMDKRRDITMAELDGDFDLFISVFTATDRIPHMLYRAWDQQHPSYSPELNAKHGNALLDVYKKADAILAEVEKKLGPTDTLLVLSDHGFHSFRRGFHTNRWLLNQGYLSVKGGKEPGDFLRNVDWSRTRAYALGTGQIYLNVKGREKNGIVQPGDEYDKLVAQISSELPKLTDPKTGKPFINRAFVGKQALRGRSHRGAPDIQIAFATGYRTSWATILGGFGPGELVGDNTRKWSGDHAASDPADTEGIFLSNKKIKANDPNIVDFAPTVLHLLGERRYPHLEGKSLF